MDSWLSACLLDKGDEYEGHRDSRQGCQKKPAYYSGVGKQFAIESTQVTVKILNMQRTAYFLA